MNTIEKKSLGDILEGNRPKYNGKPCGECNCDKIQMYDNPESDHVKCHNTHVHFAGDFDGKDSINQCDVCKEACMMSELTVSHREDEPDLFICGYCILEKAY